MEQKADSKILILSGVGTVLFLVALIRLKMFEVEIEELIEELERIE